MYKDIFVSFIVPVYNVEEYIEECLTSILKQTHEKFEVIVIDDGSPDNSGKIADGIAKKDDRIKVIHKKNNGVSSARNAGLENANGEYIIFVDSDDYIMPDYTEYMLKLIKETDTDISVSLNQYNENAISQVNDDKFEVYSSSKASQELYLGRIGVAVWNKIFKREFIEKNKLRFFEDLWFGEGMIYCISSFQKTSKIGVGRRRAYFQRPNPDSAVRKFNFDSWMCGFESLKRQRKVLDSNDKELILAWEYHYWLGCMSVCREIVKFKLINKYKGEYKKYKKYIRQHFRIPFRANISFEKKILCSFYIISPKFGYFVYSIFSKLRKKNA